MAGDRTQRTVIHLDQSVPLPIRRHLLIGLQGLVKGLRDPHSLTLDYASDGESFEDGLKHPRGRTFSVVRDSAMQNERMRSDESAAALRKADLEHEASR